MFSGFVDVLAQTEFDRAQRSHRIHQDDGKTLFDDNLHGWAQCAGLAKQTQQFKAVVSDLSFCFVRRCPDLIDVQPVLFQLPHDDPVCRIITIGFHYERIFVDEYCHVIIYY
jgi:hypothetical protein